VALEERKEKEAALTDTQKTLSGMNGKVSRAEQDAHVAREAAENAKEEAAQSKDQAVSAEEAATKAREEAAWYKDKAIELDKGKRLVESDLAAAQSTYGGVKEVLLKSEITRGTTEEAEKKARETSNQSRPTLAAFLTMLII